MPCHKKYLCNNLFNANETHMKLPLKLVRERGMLSMHWRNGLLAPLLPQLNLYCHARPGGSSGLQRIQGRRRHPPRQVAAPRGGSRGSRPQQRIQGGAADLGWQRVRLPHRRRDPAAGSGYSAAGARVPAARPSPSLAVRGGHGTRLRNIGGGSVG